MAAPFLAPADAAGVCIADPAWLWRTLHLGRAVLLPISARRIESASSAAQQAGSTVRVTDETGRTVAMPQPVRRIVSLAPNVTETLFALGLGDRVVGDTDFCDYPAEARASRTSAGR